jgi:phosphocarrier protein HPr
MSGEDKPGPAPLRARAQVTNVRGLHARAAARFVQQASQFSAEITVSFGGHTVSGRSILGLMMLGAAQGTMLEIEAGGGSDAQAAIEHLTALVEGGFDENEPAPAAGPSEIGPGRRSGA